MTALLRFRLPYPIDKVNSDYTYLNGKMFLQPWGESESAETRLVPIKKGQGYELHNYKTINYQDMLYYHNRQVRPDLQRYRNPLIGGKVATGPIPNAEDPAYPITAINAAASNQPIDPPELLNDYDSTFEALVLGNYFEFMAGRPTYYSSLHSLSTHRTEVIKLSRQLTAEINKLSGSPIGLSLEVLRNKNVAKGTIKAVAEPVKIVPGSYFRGAGAAVAAAALPVASAAPVGSQLPEEFLRTLEATAIKN